MQEALIRAIGALFTATIFCWLTLPWVIQYLTKLKIGQMIQDDGPAHQQKAHTPTMAGLWLIVVWCVTCGLWMDTSHPYFWILQLVLLGYLLLGIADDASKIIFKDNNKGLSVRVKFIFQFLLASLGVGLWLSYAGHAGINIIYLPHALTKIGLNLSILYPVFAVLVVIGSANSVNLTDGLDGLVSVPIILMCVGMSCLISLFETALPQTVLNDTQLISYLPEFIVYLSGLAGVFLAFLWYNAHPAEVFLGDTGTMCVGAVLGFLALMLKVEVYFAIMAGLFIWEAVSVMIQVGYYKLYKQRIFLMAPIHHHYEKKGWKETKVVVRFWLISVFFLLISISILLLS
ncbi:MAG: phospho-N-acetylmuramoyl-pentapeptide-transferase [Pseudomonadota bacterium]|nr:phospho-N-acetylmuramoyl-pentapeptide-transferase [Pseudomonadota bacterium]